MAQLAKILVGEVRRHPGGDGSLEDAERVVDLTNVVDGERPDVVAAAAIADDDAFDLEPQQGFADRRATDGETIGEQLFVDALSRAETPEPISCRSSAYTLSAMDSARVAGSADSTAGTDISTYTIRIGSSVSSPAALSSDEPSAAHAGSQQPGIMVQNHGDGNSRDEIRHRLLPPEG